jgi:hypothetical protein
VNSRPICFSEHRVILVFVCACLCQISWREFVAWAGEAEVPPEVLLEETVIKTILTAQAMGLSLQVTKGGQQGWL